MKNKFDVVKYLKINGDSIVSLKDNEHHCVTTDFNNKYVKSRNTKKIPMEKSKVLVFSWTANEFINLSVADITKIVPLSEILKNEGMPEGVII